MTSTIIDPAAQGLADVAAALDVTLTVASAKWAPRDLAVLPAIVVELPEGQRSEMNGRESELGSTDWFLDFDCVLYVEITDAAYTQALVAEIAEAFILAIDDDPSLGQIGIRETKVTSFGPAEILQNEPRALLMYPLHVQMLRVVAN